MGWFAAVPAAVAEKAFDQISEYLMQYGDQIFRNLEDVDDEDAKDLIELIQKEGSSRRTARGDIGSARRGCGESRNQRSQTCSRPSSATPSASMTRPRKGMDRSATRTRSLTCSATRSPT